MKEQQQQQEDRAKSWSDKVREEEKTFYLISDLIMTEYTRVNKDEEINDEVQKHISDKSKEAQDAMFGSNIKCRVEVVGLDRKDLNGRKGSIRYWDEDKSKFCVGLDTKKARDCDVHFFKPENLDTSDTSHSTKKDGKLAVNFFVAFTCDSKGGGDDVGSQFSLEKSDIIKLESARSRSNGLQAFREERDELAQRLKKEQEERRMEEELLEKELEEDRKRRKEQRDRKKAEKALKKEEERKQREEAFKLRQQQAQREWEVKQEEMRQARQTMYHKAIVTAFYQKLYLAAFHEFVEKGGGLEEFDDFKEQVKRMITSDEDDDNHGLDVDEIIEEIFEKTDEAFIELLLESTLAEDKKHAEILGVSHDADKRTLQKTYRKLALQYHPDKWSANNAHGMSKDEAEEYFKTIRNSYDHLMANFDE